MRRNLNRSSVCLFLLTAGLVGTANAEVIVNGSFEDPAVGGLIQIQPFVGPAPIGSGWNVESGVAVLVTDSYNTPLGLWPDPADGNQFLYLGDLNILLAATTVYQDVSLAAATQYRVSFELANFLGDFAGSSAQLDLDILNGGNSILGGPMTFTRPNGAGFAAQEFTFASTLAGSHRVVLSQPGGFGTNIDSFSIAAIPEPSGIAFLMLGLVAVVVRRRRFRKA